MAYSGDLISINGHALKNVLREYSVTRAKLWKDSERNMNGDIRASLIGIFPKLKLVFKDGLTEDEVNTVSALLDNEFFSVTFFDPKHKTQRTAQYYASDYETPMLDKSRGLYASFEVSLVPLSREQ